MPQQIPLDAWASCADTAKLWYNNAVPHGVEFSDAMPIVLRLIFG
jgi:hypothetical protein